MAALGNFISCSFALYTLIGVRTLAVPANRATISYRVLNSTSSTSESVINETITSHQYKTGYTYSASGHNIESETGYINPTPTTTNEQTVGGVNFNWTSPNLEAIPRWSIHKRWSSFFSYKKH